MAETTVGVAAIRLAESYGIRLAFGIPGVHTLGYYRGLANSPIRHVTPRHEQGAAFMADGVGRTGRGPALCVLTTGPGVTNAATALGEAYSDSSPLLVLSSVNARRDLGMARGRLHEVSDQRAAMAPLVAFNHTLLAAAELPQVMAHAMALMASARPRPVHIEIPIDLLDEPYRGPLAAQALPGRAVPAPDVIERAARRLAQAKRPFIIAGGGAVEAGAAIRTLAERLAAPVAMTTAGAGILPDSHPLSLGVSLASSPTRALLAKADVVLAVGTELGETDHWTERLPIAAALIRVDIDLRTFAGDYPAAEAVLADAGAAMAALAAALSDTKAREGVGVRAEIAKAKAERLADLAERRPAHAKLLAALRRALPADAILATDMTQLAYSANGGFPCEVPRGLFHPSGYGTLGFGLPAAIGAKIAAPERATCAIVGDGGLMFTLGELMCAAEEGLALPVVVYHNDGYGQIRDGLNASAIPEIGVNIAAPDFMDVARAFRCAGARPGNLAEFEAAVRQAFAADRPTLIEVRDRTAG